MVKSTFWTLFIGVLAISFSVGKLIGAATAESGEFSEASTPPQTDVVEAAAPPSPPDPVKQEAPPAQVAAATPKKPPQPNRPAPPLPGTLPVEAGVPEGDGTRPPNAEPIVMPKAPKGWLSSPAMGAAEPLVTVIVSSDFQCPVCRRVVKPVEAIARELKDEVRIEFKHHALESHARAEDAAAASMAAHKQGKFWEYHDRLFSNQRALGEGDLEEHATALGLDIVQFRKDYRDPEIRAQIRSESKASEALEARGTPGFFINGRSQVGWGSYFGFKGMITRELDKARALAKAGKSKGDIYRERARENSKNPEVFIRHFIDGEPAGQ